MLMRSISLIFMILSLTHCSRFHEPSPTASPIHGGMQVRAAGAFTRVVVNGNIDVTLYTGDINPRVILHSDSRNLPDVQTTVRDGILYVNIGKGYPHFGRVHAEIRSHYLTSFVYHGTGKVSAHNLQSRQLDLVINNNGESIINGNIALRKLLVSGSGKTQISGITGHMCQIGITGKQHVQLTGTINMTSLKMGDTSWISLYWIKSNMLKIRAKDKAFIQMAGVVERLDVELRDNARFNGRYLRGRDVFVKTHDHAVADISVIKAQHTLASDSSNIYFHRLPEMKADFMAWNGSVLDIREWDVPNLQEHTRYNR